MKYIDPDIWMTLRQAAKAWGVHYETVRRNFPKIPATERLIHQNCYYIWRGTAYRPQRGPGRPYKNYARKTRLVGVQRALPDLPEDLGELPPAQRELWLAKIDAAVEHPPGS
jgi:predicted ArsR family transcriptional regulator